METKSKVTFQSISPCHQYDNTYSIRIGIRGDVFTELSACSYAPHVGSFVDVVIFNLYKSDMYKLAQRIIEAANTIEEPVNLGVGVNDGN